MITLYHHKYSCNKCGNPESNKITITDKEDGYISECDTECTECGHKDFWAFGYFQSEEYNNAKTYERET